MLSRIHSQAQEGKIEKFIEEVNNFKSADIEKLDFNGHDAMLTEVKERRNEFTDFQTVWSWRKKPVNLNNLTLAVDLYKKRLKQTSFMMVSE